MNEIPEIMAGFNSVSLEEMDHVRLMNRMDIKYVFHAGLLPGILSRAQNHYRMLDIGGIRLFAYNSLYFDTEGLKFYLEHHNGIRPRFKVRFREYLDTGEVYLEVKRKTSKERTGKTRQQVAGIETVLSSASQQYISERIPPRCPPLLAALGTYFKRMTLVSLKGNERITIDTGLSFSCEEISKNLDRIIICEVKREASAGFSIFMRILKDNYIRSGNMSKYCLGTVLLKQGIKTNRFKENLIHINRLKNEYASYIAAV